ncbi:hypothetical protein E2562_020563 [Oryza meyeriana var. granulata]|uniref:Uncharacterized protein n=1 Tax=Oryza meyeriana var. granulata TaxID=110450 RepID=A0A6G1DYE8_9ORYZ|nr:hypothetical protein E2562_020563 [Oryza meyeriana var. granulata]
MEDLAASLMSSFSQRHSAPLYLFYNVASLPKHHAGRGGGGGGGGGFEFATAAGGKEQGGADDGDEGGGAGVRACSSDVSAAFADELFREGVLLPLKLPPRLQTPSASAAASAATSPTAASKAAPSSRSPFASRRSKHGGFDPFAAALEKVRRDVAVAPMRRARSLSPLRGPAVAAGAAHQKGNSPYAPPARAGGARPPWRRRRGMKRLLCGAAMATRPHRGDGGGAPYRRGLLVCFGF